MPLESRRCDGSHGPAATGSAPQQQQPPRPPQRPPIQPQQGAPAARQQPQRPPQQQRQQPPQGQSQFPQRPQQQPPQQQRGRAVALRGRRQPRRQRVRGLAIPPVNETDVFGQVPGSLTAGFDPSLMNDVFGGGGGGGGPVGRNNKSAAGGGAGGGRAMPTPQPGANDNADAGDAAAAHRATVRAARDQARSRPAIPGPAAGRSSGDVDQTDPTPAAQPPGRHGGRCAVNRRFPRRTKRRRRPPKKKRRWFGLKVLLPFAMLVDGRRGDGDLLLRAGEIVGHRRDGVREFLTSSRSTTAASSSSRSLRC